MEDLQKKKKMKENHKLLSHTQKEEIKKAFDFFDISGSGIIDASNLKVVLRALGFDSHKEEIVKILKEINFEEENININSKIDFQKFLNIIIYKMGEKETEENIKKAFRLFEDLEKSGKFDKEGQKEFITKSSLMNVVRSLKEEITEEEVEELIVRAINKNELLKMGEIKSDDKDEKKNFDSPQYFVTCNDFIKILNEDFINQKNFKLNK